jgi:hydroxyquinol 1,2-dioxygenase
MSGVDATTITEAFARAAEGAPNERCREVVTALVRHLHDWLRETGVTHEEWRTGIEVLTSAAAITDEHRNEFVLFSDLLGITSLVDLLNTPEGATASSPLGPFHQRGAPPLANGGDMWKGQPGQVMVVEGQVVDAQTGEGVPNATLDLWQNADNGLYSVQDPEQDPANYHGLLSCADDGSFCFSTTLFHPYSVPYDGPAGDMLRALGRDVMRAAHLHVIAEADGFKPLVTELFVEGDEWLDNDAVFGVRPDLVLPIDRSSDHSTVPDRLDARGRLPTSFLRVRPTIRMVRVGT